MYCYMEDPDNYETITEIHRCPYHSDLYYTDTIENCVYHPRCTCSISYKQVRRSDSEIARIKAEKLRKKEDEILAQAELIKYRRSLKN